jgi:hypothetical protein
MVDSAPWTPLDFPPLLMVGRGPRAARLDGRGGRRREPQPAMPRLPCGRAAIPLRRRGGQKCAGHREARGDVVGRRGNFGSGNSVVERGTSAELAARRVDDAGGDQPCGYPEDHRRDDLRPRLDAHGATAGPVYGGAEAPTDPHVRLSRPAAEPVRGGSRWGSAAPRPIRGTFGPSRGPRPTAGERTGRTSWSLRSISSSARGVCRARGPAGDCDRLDRRLSPLCWTTSLTRLSAPKHTVRTIIAGPASFPGRHRSGGGGRVDAPLSKAVEGERWRSKAGVLRPPPGPSHPKAAISASAAWRPTVAGPATGGSYGFHLSPVMWM